MQHSDSDQAGWAELRAWQDDYALGNDVRLVLRAYRRGDRMDMRPPARRLLMDLPKELAAARELLRRLRDVGQ